MMKGELYYAGDVKVNLLFIQGVQYKPERQIEVNRWVPCIVGLCCLMARHPRQGTVLIDGVY